MPLTYNPTYNELVQSLGEYEAAMQIAKSAREISTYLGNRIPMATALFYAARGELPHLK